MSTLDYPLHGRIFTYWLSTNLSPMGTKIGVEKRFDKALEHHKYRTCYISPDGVRYMFGDWCDLEKAVKEQNALIKSAEELIRKKSQ